MKRNKRKLKLLNFFNKRNNKNRKRSSGRKRPIFASAVLAGNSKAVNSQSGVSPFAEAFTVEPKFPARPGRNQAGLFCRFTPQPTPDSHNPGCAGGPWSITVLSG